MDEHPFERTDDLVAAAHLPDRGILSQTISDADGVPLRLKCTFSMALRISALPAMNTVERANWTTTSDLRNRALRVPVSEAPRKMETGRKDDRNRAG